MSFVSGASHLLKLRNYPRYIIYRICVARYTTLAMHLGGEMVHRVKSLQFVFSLGQFLSEVRSSTKAAYGKEVAFYDANEACYGLR